MKSGIRAAALALCGALAFAAAGSALAVTSFKLPTPENNPNAIYGMYPDANGVPRQAILMDGIPIAFKYDNFWSYSAKILESIQTVSNAASAPGLIPTATFGAYSFSTGTGTIDINVSSTAGGATNIVGALVFQDPVNLDNGNTIWGWKCEWGADPQTCAHYGFTGGGNPTFSSYSSPAANENGLTTVGNLLAYLQSINPTWTIPLLYADYNQTGGGDSLWMSAKVEIINNLTNAVVKSWALDSNNNNNWDQTNPTYNFGDITFASAANCTTLWNPVTGVGCAGTTISGNTYAGSHNLGSGKADFMAFAPDMDLTQFNPNFIFKVTIDLGCIPNITSPYPGTTRTGCNTNGAEEFGVIGGVGPTIFVPEPGSLALLGVAMVAAGFARRRRLAA